MTGTSAKVNAIHQKFLRRFSQIHTLFMLAIAVHSGVLALMFMGMVEYMS
jgi:hypothetical protein